MGTGRAVSASAGPQRGAPVPRPLRSAAPSAPHGRGGSGAGSPWGPRAQGAGSPPPGPRDRFVYKHCRARGGSRSGGGREGPPGRGPGPVGGTGRVWGGDLAEGTGRRSRCCFLSVAPWVRTFSVPGDAGWLPAADCGCWSGAPGPRRWGAGRPETPGGARPPRAEVAAAEFLPRRLPAPPRCPCQGAGREFAPAPRAEGPLRRAPPGSGAEGRPPLRVRAPLTSSGCLSPSGGSSPVGGRGNHLFFWTQPRRLPPPTSLSAYSCLRSQASEWPPFFSVLCGLL